MAKYCSAALAEKFYIVESSAQRPILAIEASDTDFAHLSTALRDAGVANPVWRCSDSDTAFAAFGTAEGCAKTQGTAFALLDLDMPDADGRDLLLLFRQQEHKLPVIVLSSSSHPADVAFCYRAGANTVLAKPSEYDQWRDMMATVAAYWLRIAILPAGRPPMQFRHHVMAQRSRRAHS